MSAVTHILNHRAKVVRQTSYLLDAVPAGLTFSLDRQPVQQVRLGIELDGCTIFAGASCTITGNAGTETIQLTDNARFAGALFFSNISGLTMGGVQGGLVQARALNATAQPVIQDLVINASMPCRFFMHEGRIKVKPAGQMEAGVIQMMCEPNVDVSPADVITCLTGLEQVTLARVVHYDLIYDFDNSVHHTEALLNNIS